MAYFGDADYRPIDDEPYMNARQLRYFRQKLLDMQARIHDKIRETLHEIRERETRETDIIDRSDLETLWEMKLRACRHYRRTIEQLTAALARIDDGTYGYCRMTGDEIGLRRLEIVPHASLSLDAQEIAERHMA
ncbi:TraR/DksA family transcriptional regulator [Desulfococcus sp.]|uniref:TraR/DksA family transcriptional regulator n=1 Tax=Desulfococcus sp. TaxID=2025834 RepID=UPI00359439C1